MSDDKLEKAKAAYTVTDEERWVRLEGDWSFAQIDKFAVAAAKVLPCQLGCVTYPNGETRHRVNCFAVKRPAVAQAMREQAKELEAENDCLRAEVAAEHDRLLAAWDLVSARQAEVEGLKAKIVALRKRIMKAQWRNYGDNQT